MRRRDAQVFAGTGWTLVRARATVGEGVGKIREGVGFFSRGVRLLGSDVSSAGRLFYRAGAGASLKPREVRAVACPCTGTHRCGECSCTPWSPLSLWRSAQEIPEAPCQGLHSIPPHS